MLLSFARTRCDSPRLVSWPACCAWSCRGYKTRHWCSLHLCGLCVAWCVPVCIVRAQAPAAKTFFNRAEELNRLQRLLSSPPCSTGITVVIGPPSCGKTALVQHYLEGLKQPQPAIYIDCRSEAVSTPDSFASTLLSTTASAGEQFKSVVAGIAEPFFRAYSAELQLDGETVDYGSASGLVGGIMARSCSTPIAVVLDILGRALRQTYEEGRPTPPIIIDEANKLIRWSTAHPVELDMLLSFFVAVSKQQDWAHVLLLTSDYAYVNWLEKGKHIGLMIAVVLRAVLSS